MRVSLGLCPESHTCRYHGVKMKAKVERAPKFLALNAAYQAPKRIIYRCVIAGCAFCDCGPIEYRQCKEEKKCVSALGRYYAD